MRLSVFIAVVTTATSLIGCGQDKSKREPTPVDKPVAPQAKALTQKERNSIIAEATYELVETRDKMEKVSFYKMGDAEENSRRVVLGKERLSAYISVPDEGSPALRIRICYFGDDWIFFDRIKVMSDDVVVYEKSYEHSSVNHRNIGSHVLETADYPASSGDLDAIRKIASAKKSTIRLYGDSRRDDHELTESEIGALRTVLKAFDQLSKLDPKAQGQLEDGERP